MTTDRCCNVVGYDGRYMDLVQAITAAVPGVAVEGEKGRPRAFEVQGISSFQYI